MGLCVGPCGSPRGGAVSYEPGTPVTPTPFPRPMSPDQLTVEELGVELDVALGKYNMLVKHVAALEQVLSLIKC